MFILKNKIQNGHVLTKKLRVVCRSCNSGWMSRIENDTKSILSPLALGDIHDIDEEMQIQLAQWITLRVIVGEQTSPDRAVIRKADRAAFKTHNTIPDGVTIYIARCLADIWNAAYHRHSALISSSLKIVPDRGTQNIQTSCFGVGQLFVICMASTSQGRILNLNLSDHFVRLWPLSGTNPIIWPPMKILSAHEADVAAWALDTFFKTSQVVWP